MPRVHLRHHVRRMDDATERLDERGRRRLERSSDLDCIHRRHCNELREPTRQTRDAVLAIKLTLVTVASAAIFTQHFTTTTDAIQALIDHDAIAFAQIAHPTAELLDNAGNLVTENLWLQSERDRLAILVCVVVCVAREDVNVSAAKPD